ncbi:MAG: toxin-antitoxin system HicB family antitoxin [Acidimicrobiia bacterium]
MPKTLAIRLDDELHAAAAAVAQLEGISLTELIRSSLEAHLEAKRDSGELAERAQSVLEQIEAEAEVRRQAITGLLGSSTTPPAGKPTRRRKPAE